MDEQHRVHHTVVVGRVGNPVGPVVVVLGEVDRRVRMDQRLAQPALHSRIGDDAPDPVAVVAAVGVVGTAARGPRVHALVPRERHPPRRRPLNAEQAVRQLFVEGAQRVRPARRRHRAEQRRLVLRGGARVQGGGTVLVAEHDHGNAQRPGHDVHRRRAGRGGVQLREVAAGEQPGAGRRDRPAPHAPAAVAADVEPRHFPLGRALRLGRGRMSLGRSCGRRARGDAGEKERTSRHHARSPERLEPTPPTTGARCAHSRCAATARNRSP